MKNDKKINNDSKQELVMDQQVITVLEKIFDPIPVPIIMLDKDTKILLINKAFLAYLKVEKEDAIGKDVIEVDKASRFPYVLQNKKEEIAWKHTFQGGQTAIVHRIPVLNNDGNVLYAFGMILFQDMEEVRSMVEKNKILESELHHYKKQLIKIQGANYKWENIVGESKNLNQVKYIGRKASQTESTVLLMGESGTGKELFAHSIHNDSKRSPYPFVKLNCAAIPTDLLESELFGYDEGAFTGAKKGGKVGKFELANKGTIFLDEIGDMPLNMQAKLLRVLQDKEIERVGGNKQINVDVRVIAATNKNLEELVKKGEFREDLYYRINVMVIEVPALRDRLDDIEALSKNLLEKISQRLGKYVIKISHEAMSILKRYNWPGNVRELENTLERAINLTDGDTITVDHLPYNITKKAPKTIEEPIRELNDIVADAEKDAILRCLEYTKGNKLKTSKLLNISRSSLYDKIEKYGIEV
ncbi:sigma 54-interacting transcriptional regulator [Serpentinicella sp. ANB-PHB4]|uniref:sigma-54 interaction domain-containing protein n=1 Tax=Serpentinicella sp. ANB-PHB4 TaxID=3074076 RepID=UPI00285D5AFF|nr:sigma 54-interacting transcriptional regulator [Serpentinicella sp. ANB-PHB4]MDR5658603.1 sigma 54-interacting transcriptional regulator [Serpentinicella sp. ANB-PHB4]